APPAAANRAIARDERSEEVRDLAAQSIVREKEQALADKPVAQTESAPRMAAPPPGERAAKNAAPTPAPQAAAGRPAAGSATWGSVKDNYRRSEDPKGAISGLSVGGA